MKSSRESIERRAKQGYGSGEGASYIPWLKPRDVPSKGLTTRLPGVKAGRQHVVLSKIERACLSILDRLSDVVDIKEQFPLFPIDETMRIAATLGVRHPTPPGGGLAVVTADFNVTRRDPTGLVKQQLLAVKPSTALSNERTLEKLEIERLYARARGWEWAIVTERELPAALVANLDWMSACYDILPEALAIERIPEVAEHLLVAFNACPSEPLNEVCASVDAKLGLPTGRSLTVFGHMLARDVWSLDFSKAVDFSAPPPTLVIAGRRRGATT